VQATGGAKGHAPFLAKFQNLAAAESFEIAISRKSWKPSPVQTRCELTSCPCISFQRQTSPNTHALLQALLFTKRVMNIICSRQLLDWRVVDFNSNKLLFARSGVPGKARFVETRTLVGHVTFAADHVTFAAATVVSRSVQCFHL